MFLLRQQGPTPEPRGQEAKRFLSLATCHSLLVLISKVISFFTYQHSIPLFDGPPSEMFLYVTRQSLTELLG